MANDIAIVIFRFNEAFFSKKVIKTGFERSVYYSAVVMAWAAILAVSIQ